MLLITFLYLIVFNICIAQRSSKNNFKHVFIYNFGDYIDPKILKMFTEETNIKVSYDTFSISEEAYTKIKNSNVNYDVVFISDYMIERLVKDNLLEPLNFNLIGNYKSIAEQFKDPKLNLQNKYCVPYSWGTMGILYNTKLVKEYPNSWEFLWSEKYKDQIFMYDSQRDTIAVALKYLGYSVNTHNITELEKAKKILIQQKKIIQAYVGDIVKEKMINEDGMIAASYSGDAYYAWKENHNLNYVIPEEGSNLWLDCVAIPSNAKNKDNAYMFINFLCRPDIAIINTNYNGYSTTNIDAFNNLPDEIKNNKIYWPNSEDFRRCEVYYDLGDLAKKYNIIWAEILSTS
jgi:spermidine/putrescine transport system substrate-binding protein